MIFHLVSRTHRHERWFVPSLRTEIARLTRTMISRTDAELIAYAIMPNHLHIIMRQGEAPLGAVMQPLLRRVAHRVQRHHDFEGGVVERRFRDRVCRTPDHVREAIIYTHLNPWRAGLCGRELEYPWSTAAAYRSGADPSVFGIDPRVQMRVLELFALDHRRVARDHLCGDHATWLEWRMARDDALHDPTDDLPATGPFPQPQPVFGDSAWRKYFTADVGSDVYRRRPLPDLRDFVRARTGRIAPGIKIEQLLGSRVSHRVSRIRNEVIRAAAEYGYRTVDIARFFAVSPQTVSRAKYAPGDGMAGGDSGIAGSAYPEIGNVVRC